MSFQVFISFLHIGSGQILMVWCNCAMYGSRNLVGCNGALGEAVNDDKVEAFREVL